MSPRHAPPGFRLAYRTSGHLAVLGTGLASTVIKWQSERSVVLLITEIFHYGIEFCLSVQEELKDYNESRKPHDEEEGMRLFDRHSQSIGKDENRPYKPLGGGPGETINNRTHPPSLLSMPSSHHQSSNPRLTPPLSPPSPPPRQKDDRTPRPTQPLASSLSSVPSLTRQNGPLSPPPSFPFAPSPRQSDDHPPALSHTPLSPSPGAHLRRDEQSSKPNLLLPTQPLTSNSTEYPLSRSPSPVLSSPPSFPLKSTPPPPEESTPSQPRKSTMVLGASGAGIYTGSGFSGAGTFTGSSANATPDTSDIPAAHRFPDSGGLTGSSSNVTNTKSLRGGNALDRERLRLRRNANNFPKQTL